MDFFWSQKFSFLRRAISVALIALHILAVGPTKDALAEAAASLNFKLESSSITEGGSSKGPVNDKKIQIDTIGEPFGGSAESTLYKLNTGYLHSIARNSPPVLTHQILSMSWKTGTQNTNAIGLDEYFQDPEGDEITYSVSGNNKIEVTIDAQEHTVTFGQPAAFRNQNETVKFIATDSQGNVAYSNPVILHVVDEPGLPVLKQINDSVVLAGREIQIHPEVSNPNNIPYNVIFDYPLNSWQKITDYKWLAPADHDNYTYENVIVRLVDAADRQIVYDEKFFNITVRRENHPPYFESIGGVKVEGQDAIELSTAENTPFEIKPVAKDPDNDSVRIYYDVKENDSGRKANIEPDGIWHTTYEDAGTYIISVIAFDGFEQVSQDVRITVEQVWRPLSINVELGKYAVSPGETFDVIINADDPEGFPMTYTVLQDDATIKSGEILNNTAVYVAASANEVRNNHTIEVKLKGKNDRTASSGIIKFNVSGTNNEIKPVAGDFDGNGLNDVGLYNPENGDWEIALSSEGKIKDAQVWLSGFGGKECIPIGGDFNGDNISDIGIYNYDTGKLKIATSSKSSFTDNGEWFNFDDHSYDWTPISGNFDGDRFADFGVYNIKTGEIRIALGTGSGFSVPAPVQWINGFGGNDEWTPLVGDFNGDSLADICIFNKKNGRFKIALSNNRQFLDKGEWLTKFANDEDAFVADFNNDGLTDIGYLTKGGSLWQMAINTGSAFENRGTWIEHPSTKEQSPTTGDFNGDGITDAALYDKTKPGINRWSLKLNAGRPPDFLERIDNGKGGLVNVEYDYTRGSEKDFLPFPVFVARKITSTDTISRGYYPSRADVGFDVDRNNSYSHEFKFEQAYYDAAEREFRGFGKVTAIDPVTLNYTETYFLTGKNEQDPALKGQIKEIRAYENYGSNLTPKLVSIVTNEYDVARGGPLQDGLASPRLKETVTTVYEKYENVATSLTLKSGYEYDPLGNVVKEISYGEKDKTGDERESVSEFNLPYETGHNTLKSTILNDQNGKQAARKDFEYYEDSGLLKKETAWFDADPANSPSTQYEYDDYGNIACTINAKGRKVYTTYETDFFAFPKTISNELGHTITYTYYPEFGSVYQITDANGKITTTEYDSLGRLVKELNTEGKTVTTYEYPNLNTKITRQLNLYTKEYFDGLGRKYKTVSNGEDDGNLREISTEVYYNKRGFVQAESLAHYIDEDPSQITYTRYKYDLRSRVIETIQDFPGTDKDTSVKTYYKTVAYVEAEDSKGFIKGTLKDIFGNTTEIREFIKDPDNMERPQHFDEQGRGYYLTRYEFDAKNNLIKLIDNKQNQTSITYDSLGRKLSLNDPDTGTTTYDYDVMGNLICQKDNKGQIITLNYDDINRLKQKVYNGKIAAEYLYDTYESPSIKDINCIGRLTRVTDENGYQVIYFYDNEGRAYQARKIIDGKAYDTSTKYDILDRVTEASYPENSEQLTYGYDKNSGLLESIQGKSGHYYASEIVYNAQGQMRTAKFGNNTRTVYDYGRDLRLRNLSTFDPAGKAIQDLNYEFDKNGNVASITDDLLPDHKTRAYRYDDLNRLIRAENIPDPKFTGTFQNLDYRYDSIGNMTYKSDVGSMEYPSSVIASPEGAKQSHPGPHAVISAGPHTYTYDANGNMASGAGRTMEYDYANRLAKVIDAQGKETNFVYGVSTERIKQINDGLATTYISSTYEVEEAASGEKRVKFHIFLGSNRICSVTLPSPQRGDGQGEGEIFYYHSDHLGSSNVITGHNGGVIQVYEYTPYGTLAVNSTNSTNSANSTKYLFTGKELDSSGLYYYGARYYDPYIGRFIQPDPIVQSPGDSQSLNRYAYARNNPLKYTDPTGHFFWFAAIIGAIIGAALGGISAAINGTPIWKGILCGAISGFGAGAGTWQLALLYGIFAGAATSAISGGNIGIGAGIGAFSSLAGFGIGSAFGVGKEAVAKQFIRGLAASVVTGGIAGAAGAAAFGGDIGQGAWMGAAFAAGGFLSKSAIGKAVNKPAADAQKEAKVDETKQEVSSDLSDGNVQQASEKQESLQVKGENIPTNSTSNSQNNESKGINWKTVGIGALETTSGIGEVVVAIKFSVVTSGIGLLIAGSAIQSGIFMIGAGVADIMTGFYGNDKPVLVQIKDVIKDNPIGNRSLVEKGVF